MIQESDGSGRRSYRDRGCRHARRLDRQFRAIGNASRSSGDQYGGGTSTPGRQSRGQALRRWVAADGRDVRKQARPLHCRGQIFCTSIRIISRGSEGLRRVLCDRGVAGTDCNGFVDDLPSRIAASPAGSRAGVLAAAATGKKNRTRQHQSRPQPSHRITSGSPKKQNYTLAFNFLDES